MNTFANAITKSIVLLLNVLSAMGVAKRKVCLISNFDSGVVSQTYASHDFPVYFEKISADMNIQARLNSDFDFPSKF